MTIKDVLIRFSVTYLILIFSLFLINALLSYFGIAPIGSVGIVILIGAILYTCQTFAKKNDRYFTAKEKKHVVIGFIIINYIIEGIITVVSGITNSLAGNVLLISFGMVLIINPLLIYIFVGIAGIGAAKRYGSKEEIATSQNKYEAEIIHNEHSDAKGTVRTLWAMLIFIFLSTLVLLYVGYVYGAQFKQPANLRFSVESMRNVLYIIAIITLLLSFFIRKRMLSVAPLSITSLQTLRSDQAVYLRKYSLAVMISFGFSLLIGIYGIILLLVGSDYLTFCIFMVTSLISLCYYRPKASELNNLVLAPQQKEKLEPKNE